MRILYITHYGDMYGANLSLLNMMLYMRDKLGIEPIVLLGNTGTFQRELEKHNIQYVFCKYSKCTVNITTHGVLAKKYIKKILRIVSYPMVYNKLRRIIKIKGINLIHSNSSVVDIGYYLSQKFNCSHIWHVREYGNEDYNLIQIDNVKAMRRKYNKASCIIAISQSIKKMIVNITPDANTKVVYNGIHVVSAYNKKYCIDGKVHFCIVGLISPNKKQLDTVKAVKLLVDEHVDGFCLHIVGGGYQNEDKKLLKYVQDNNLENYVEFAGYISQINEYLVNMDVGIMSSAKEAFGRTTVEYMSHYMPVIGSADGGTVELIEQNNTGYLYCSGDVGELAEYMKSFICDRNSLFKMGTNARRFSEKFTIEKNALNVYDIYSSVLGGSKQ